MFYSNLTQGGQDPHPRQQRKGASSSIMFGGGRLYVGACSGRRGARFLGSFLLLLFRLGLEIPRAPGWSTLSVFFFFLVGYAVGLYK